MEKESLSKVPVIQLQKLSKTFPGVQALKEVSFDVYKGEVHALVGENGSGKSTLVKILNGACHKDSGRIILNGHPVEILNPHMAQALGISAVYQELNLVPALSVAENIFMGHYPEKRYFKSVDWQKMKKEARAVMKMLGIELDVDMAVKRLGVAYQQIVEIAKFLSMDMEAEILAMDEPTATLASQEIEKLFEVISRLKSQGVAILYVSHRLEEIVKIADRVTILRDGRCMGTFPVQDITLDQIIRLMVGRDLTEKFPREKVPVGKEVLRIENLCQRDVVRDVNLVVRQGEIVGIAGLVGSGRTELARAIFGADPVDKGKIYLFGRQVKIRSPQDAVRNGIGLLPEERRAHGLIPLLSVSDNVALSILDRIARYGFVNRILHHKIVKGLVEKLDIRPPRLEQKVRYLSGGNQQKVVIAKWFARKCHLYIFDEPTRGIDVGTKVEIYRLMNRLLKEGAAILMISSELPELLAMADRIYVMSKGRLVAEIPQEEAIQGKVLSALFHKSGILKG